MFSQGKFFQKKYKRIIIPIFLIFFFLHAPVFAEKTTTTLTDPKQKEIFWKVTEELRCICLPSIPIQQCSYNMCVVSSYLKTFIENRIKEGMDAPKIIAGFENGFGEANFFLNDSVIQHFQETGQENMIQALKFGFGPKILSKPDSTWINSTLYGLAFLGFLGMVFYLFYLKGKK